MTLPTPDELKEFLDTFNIEGNVTSAGSQIEIENLLVAFTFWYNQKNKDKDENNL